MTYRQQVMQAIDESKRNQKVPPAKRKRIYLSDEEEEDFAEAAHVENTVPERATRRSTRRRSSMHEELGGTRIA